MRRSEVEESLKYWKIGDLKVYKYVRAFAPAEFIVFRCEEKLVVCEVKLSTYKLKDMDPETFVLMLISDELAFWKNYSLYDSKESIMSLKTGNCHCGAWILKDNEYLHTTGCPRYKKDM